MFTNEQLAFIKDAARSVKNQGELAVAAKIILTPEFHVKINGKTYFSSEQLTVLDYCAQECKRQCSGEMSVYWMVNAWDYAHTYMCDLVAQGNGDEIDLHFISHLGALVEPNKNLVHESSTFRRIPIGVTDGMGGWIEKAEWAEVPRLLTQLLESYYDGALEWHYKEHRPSNPIAKTAEDQFYFEYENIHPFVDGNGRTGKILYNYLLGKLDDPVMPPNFWGSSNP